MSIRGLAELRLEINDIDEKMIELFKMRMQLVKEVAQYKVENDMEVLDGSREEFIIKKHTENVKDPELSEEIGEFIECMLRISRAAQKGIIDSYKR